MNEPILLLLIALIALIFRTLYFFQLKNSSPIYALLIHDSALFNELANRVLQNGLILEHVFYISPLYIYFLALVYEIFGNSFAIVRVIQFILGTGTALLTYGLGKKLFDQKVGAIAGLLAAVYAPFLFFDGSLLGTSLGTFLLIASMYCLLATGTKGIGYVTALLSGLLLSLAVTERPNLIFLTIIPIIFFLSKKNTFKKKSIILAALVVLGIFIPLGLTSLHNYLAEKDMTPLTTHGGINFFIGNNSNASGVWEAPEGIAADVSAINLEASKRFAEKATGKQLTPSQVSQFWYKRAFAFIANHPIKWLRLLGKKFLLFWSSYETPLNFDYYFHQRYSSLLRLPFFNLTFYMPLAILGLLLYGRECRRLWLLYAVIGLICVSIVLFFMADRYRISALPFLIIIAAAGLVEFVNIIRTRGSKRLIWSGALILLFVIQIGHTQARVKKTHFANDLYNISLAHLINNNPKEAVYWGTRAVKDDPMLKNAHYNLGIAFLKLDDKEKAFEAFSRVVELDSTDAAAQRNLGGLLLLREEFRKALPHLQASVRLEPDNVKGLMNLGLVYYRLREFEMAMQTWQKILKIEPQNEQAKNNIKAAQSALGYL